MTDPISRCHIGILDYPGAQLAALHGLTDLFAMANRVGGADAGNLPQLVVSHWRIDASGDQLEPGWISQIGSLPPLTAVILPPSLDQPPLGNAREPIIAWIRRQHGEGAILCSVCAGAFLLADSGLLQRRSVTTHWNLAARLSEAHSDILVDSDQLLIDDGDIITAGGIMSWVDLGLRLVERLISLTVMQATARMLLVDPPGRQQRFYSSFLPKLSHGDGAIRRVQHWLPSQIGEKISVPQMAAQAELEERTFLRRFLKATGLRPSEYLQSLRVAKARELLEAGRLPIEQIAWRLGYDDPGAFRKIFRKMVGLTAGDYRRRFAGGAIE